MKQTILLLLVLGVALAGSALEKEDFSYAVKDNPVTLTEDPILVRALVQVTQLNEVNAFNITIRFNGAPNVMSQEQTNTLDLLKPGDQAPIAWYMNTSQPGEYDWRQRPKSRRL